MRNYFLFDIVVNLKIKFEFVEFEYILNESDKNAFISIIIETLQNNNLSLEPKNFHSYLETEVTLNGNLPDEINFNSFLINTNRIMPSGNSFNGNDFEYKLISNLVTNYIPIKKYVKPYKIKDTQESDYQKEIKIKCTSNSNSERPKFEITNYWDEFHNRRDVNCFRWAINSYNIFDNDLDPPKEKYEKDKIIRILFENEYLNYIGPNFEKCENNIEIIAMFLNEDIGYHFLRLDNDGTWSHKDGLAMPSKLDYNLLPINKIENAHLGPYNIFCGFFIKNKKIKLTNKMTKVVNTPITLNPNDWSITSPNPYKVADPCNCNKKDLYRWNVKIYDDEIQLNASNNRLYFTLEQFDIKNNENAFISIYGKTAEYPYPSWHDFQIDIGKRQNEHKNDECEIFSNTNGKKLKDGDVIQYQIDNFHALFVNQKIKIRVFLESKNNSELKSECVFSTIDINLVSATNPGSGTTGPRKPPSSN